jgi:hypothetical protein
VCKHNSCSIVFAISVNGNSVLLIAWPKASLYSYSHFHIQPINKSYLFHLKVSLEFIFYQHYNFGWSSSHLFTFYLYYLYLYYIYTYFIFILYYILIIFDYYLYCIYIYIYILFYFILFYYSALLMSLIESVLVLLIYWICVLTQQLIFLQAHSYLCPSIFSVRVPLTSF